MLFITKTINNTFGYDYSGGAPVPDPGGGMPKSVSSHSMYRNHSGGDLNSDHKVSITGVYPTPDIFQLDQRQKKVEHFFFLDSILLQFKMLIAMIFQICN
jgi:hypothetical protein